MHKIPVVALFGLPNSGKSTLINRICSFNKAVVANEAHTTRDVNWGDDVWEDMYFKIVDTGGLIPNPDDVIKKEVQIRTWGALAEADLLVWVIDRKQNPETISLDIMQRVWKLNKPFIIGVNKVDEPKHEKNIADYAALGGVDFVNFSAAGGYNLNILLDKLVEQLEKMGFEKGHLPSIQKPDIFYPKGKHKINKSQFVRQNSDGTYTVFRENTEEGPGLYFSEDNSKVKCINHISNIILNYDSLGNLNQNQLSALLGFYNYTQTNTVSNFLEEVVYWFALNKTEKKLDESKVDEEEVYIEDLIQTNDSKNFNLVGKSLKEINSFLDELDLESKHCLYLDTDEKAIETALENGMWAVNLNDIQEYETKNENTGEEEEANAEEGEDYIETDENEDGVYNSLSNTWEEMLLDKHPRVPKIPKILFLGKPNVGKSTLFNTMVGKQIQIVSDIPGTTLSVNETLVERKK